MINRGRDTTDASDSLAHLRRQCRYRRARPAGTTLPNQAPPERPTGPQEPDPAKPAQIEGTVLRLSTDELVRLARRLRPYLTTPSPTWPAIVDAADWLRGIRGGSLRPDADASFDDAVNIAPRSFNRFVRASAPWKREQDRLQDSL